MLQVVSKWKVTVKFVDREVVIYVYDHFIANVLRMVAGIEFSGNGLEQPIEITVAQGKSANDPIVLRAKSKDS